MYMFLYIFLNLYTYICICTYFFLIYIHMYVYVYTFFFLKFIYIYMYACVGVFRVSVKYASNVIHACTFPCTCTYVYLSIQSWNEETYLFILNLSRRSKDVRNVIRTSSYATSSLFLGSRDVS